MKRFFLIATAILCSGLFPVSASAVDSWIFRPSYYSHHPAHPVKIGGQPPSGRAYYTRTYGEYVRSGFRQTRSMIRNGRGGIDNTNVFESWIQTGGQY